jgi:hypothetical protein
MPVSLKRLRQSGTSVFLHLCETCGAEASFGYGVDMRLAMKKLAAGDVAGAKRCLGRWYCGEHRKEVETDVLKP